MKISTNILLIFIFQSLSAQSWFDTNAGISQNKHGDLVLLDANTVYVIADHGKFYQTFDGGDNWTEKNLNIDINFYAIDFLNTQFGFVAGTSGALLKTSDGGTTWTILNTGTGESISAISILNDNDIFCVGTNGTFLQSNDGGTTWTNRTELTSNNLYDIDFMDDTTGYAIGNNIVLKTTDAGTTWDAIITTDSDLYGPDFYSLSFDNQKIRMVYGDFYPSDFSSIGWGNYVSNDGGLTWQMEMAYPMCTTEYMTSATASNNILFWTAIEYSHTMNMYKWDMNNSDEGMIWGYQGYSSTPIKRALIKAIDENILYMFYDDKVLKTIDGGVNAVEDYEKTAISLSPNPTSDFVHIHTKKKIQKITVTDISGKIVLETNTNDFSILHLPDGIYFVKGLLANHLEFNKKLIIKH